MNLTNAPDLGAYLTDEDLRFLTKLPNLRSVSLSGPFSDLAVPILSQTTAEGVAAKQTAKQTLISDAGQQNIAKALLPNRQRGKREQQFAEFEKAKALADAGLSCLALLKPLRGLHIACEGVTGKGLAVLKDLPDLANLNIWVKNLEAQGLDNLQGLTKLKSLDIPCPVSDEALSRLVGLDSLVTLRLGPISDDGLQYVAQLPQLTGLGIAGAPDFTGRGLRHIAGLTRLEGLSISDAPGFTGNGWEHLTTLVALRSVSFSNNGVLGESLVHLASLPALTELKVWDVPLAEAGVRHIGELKQLKQLSIGHSTLVDDHLKYLSNLVQLERLSLGENGISDEGIAHLAKTYAALQSSIVRSSVIRVRTPEAARDTST